MTVRYTPAALADLSAIAAWIGDRNPAGARNVLARVKGAIDLADAFPGIGATTDEPGIRRALALPYPYAIFYETTASAIVVHAVRHAKREPRGAA